MYRTHFLRPVNAVTRMGYVRMRFGGLIFHVVFFRLSYGDRFFRFAGSNPIIEGGGVFCYLLHGNATTFRNAPYRMIYSDYSNGTSEVCNTILMRTTILNNSSSFFRRVEGFLLKGRLVSICPYFREFFGVGGISRLFFCHKGEEILFTIFHIQ